MDFIEIKVKNNQNDNYQSRSVTILINGRDIVELLKHYELPFAKKEGSESIAGAYDGLSPEALFSHLTKPDEYDIDEDGKVSILECECGCEGCWPMKVKVVDLGDKVVWTDFEQPHRTRDGYTFWDYTDFGQFVFDKNNYREQLFMLERTDHSRLS